MNNPLVSIGVPCYNRPEGLNRLLSQLSMQSFSNIEIIVSDNCSPDPNVFSTAQDHSRRDSRIKIFRQSRNLGPVVNHDFVKKQSRGKYFLWIHDDDELPANYVEICVKHLEEEPGAVLVGPSCDRYLDGQYWLTYENWSSTGQSTYKRLLTLMPDAFNFHWRFEQYTSGLFLREAAPKHVSKDFKAQFYHFFVLSEAGTIIHAPELKLIKHTDQENMRKYSTGEAYQRHWVLKFFSQESAVSMQQCVPLTLQMLKIIIKSKFLSINEKIKLLVYCMRLFIHYPVKHELNIIKQNWRGSRVRRKLKWAYYKIK